MFVFFAYKCRRSRQVLMFCICFLCQVRGLSSLVGFRESYPVLSIFLIVLDVFGRLLSLKSPSCPQQWLLSPVPFSVSWMSPFLAIMSQSTVAPAFTGIFHPCRICRVWWREPTQQQFTGTLTVWWKTALWELNAGLFHVVNAVYHHADHRCCKRFYLQQKIAFDFFMFIILVFFSNFCNMVFPFFLDHRSDKQSLVNQNFQISRRYTISIT